MGDDMNQNKKAFVTGGAGFIGSAWANENASGRGILKDGSNIGLVNPNERTRLAETIIDLLLDHQKRRQIGERASQTIREHFSWESVCSKTVEAYKKILQ
jgi:glycosyltransferase involved in cell wall biosynthesis